MLWWPLVVLGHLLHHQAMAVQGTPLLPPVLQWRGTALLLVPTTTVAPRSVATAVAVRPARPVLRLGLDARPEPMDWHGSGPRPGTPANQARLTMVESLTITRSVLTSLAMASPSDYLAPILLLRMGKLSASSARSMIACALFCSMPTCPDPTGLKPCPRPLKALSCQQRSHPVSTLVMRPLAYEHLRVFACLCFPNQASTAPHKLAARSTPCILLGYPTDDHGYRCLDLHSRRVITSRHVIFDETRFPFLTEHFQTTATTAIPATVTESPVVI